ncbi:MAG TPA: NAD(P)/FAD-dependent oxidoreductase, partial [Verrucomicrobiae bacterium]|nr:NAD(P)/FAD-dependent oxidoreductase [Verrucomicrobiae bacterium]
MKLAGHYDFDVAIIGGGSAGYAAARTAAGAGLKTIVIEGGEEVGGLCILRGCMPTKTLLYAAEVMHLVNRAETWGIRVEKAGFDFAKVMARKNALIKDFADYRRRQLESGKFEFIRADARFIDPHTVELKPIPSENGERTHPQPLQGGELRQSRTSIVPLLNGARGGSVLTARHFIIATGSNIAPSPLPQLCQTPYLTSDTALELARLPQSLIVLGGGAVAVEFAQFFARFGVRVTLIQRSAQILHETDPDAASVIENVFRREGIEVFTNTKITDVRCDGLKTVSFLHEGEPVSVAAEEIFYALGRVPNTASLDLDKAGVATERGRIIANDLMQTSAPHIYTAGDCTGPHEIVHIAVQQGEIAAHNIAHPDTPRRLDHRLLVTLFFTDPQLATVGLTEKAARVRNVPYLAASYPFNDHGKSLIMEAKDGFVKLLADPASGEILGGACVGPLGGELIHEIVTAMAKRMIVHELAA